MLIIRQTGVVLAQKVQFAETFFARARGLIGRPPLRPGEALVISKCQMVHMFFMRQSIDVIFCTVDWRVVGLKANLLPWRISQFYRDAFYVAELPPQRIADCQLKIGDRLKLCDLP